MRKYEKPIFTLVNIEIENIVCTSTPTFGGGEGGDGDVIPYITSDSSNDGF